MSKKLLSGAISHYKIGKLIIWKIKHGSPIYDNRRDTGLALSFEHHNFINILYVFHLGLKLH